MATSGLIRLERVLPMPPSTNHLFATVRTKQGGTRRVATRQYTDWREVAGQLGKPWPRYSEDTRNQIGWTLHLTAWNLSRRRDADNIAKGCVDLIVTHTGLRDNYLDHLVIQRAWDEGDERVLVRLEVTVA